MSRWGRKARDDLKRKILFFKMVAREANGFGKKGMGDKA